MNLTITKEQILTGLQAVQNVVSTRTTLPILSNVLLRAEGDRRRIYRHGFGCDRGLFGGSQGEKRRGNHRAGEKTLWHRSRIERQRN